MSIAQVVNHGKKFDCGCANKWEWLSVNGSQIGLVCLRREKPLGHSNSVYMCGFQNKQKNCCTTPNGGILLSMKVMVLKLYIDQF